MRLEDQVSSLELSKKLKELGATQKSLFYWQKIDSADVRLRDQSSSKWVISYYENRYGGCETISAFNVAELGNMLPDNIKMIRITYTNVGCQWVLTDQEYQRDTSYTKNYITSSKEADSRAKMLIYMIEKKLITKI